MCCGRTRPAFGPTLANSRPVAAGGTVLAYTGRTALTVTGPATRVVYRFAQPGSRLRIDPRDAPALAKIASLRPAG